MLLEIPLYEGFIVYLQKAKIPRLRSEIIEPILASTYASTYVKSTKVLNACFITFKNFFIDFVPKINSHPF